MSETVTPHRVNFYPSQWSWIQREAGERGTTASALLRVLVDREKETKAAEAAVEVPQEGQERKG